MLSVLIFFSFQLLCIIELNSVTCINDQNGRISMIFLSVHNWLCNFYYFAELCFCCPGWGKKRAVWATLTQILSPSFQITGNFIQPFLWLPRRIGIAHALCIDFSPHEFTNALACFRVASSSWCLTRSREWRLSLSLISVFFLMFAVGQLWEGEEPSWAHLAWKALLLTSWHCEKIHLAVELNMALTENCYAIMQSLKTVQVFLF